MTCLFAALYSTFIITIADGLAAKTGTKQSVWSSRNFELRLNFFLASCLHYSFQDQPDSSNPQLGQLPCGTGEADPAAWAAAISSYIVLSAAMAFSPIPP
jgi:hypothetical protein